MCNIKFRGRDMTGHFVYGLLTRKKIRSNGTVVFAIAQSEKQSETIPVNENSIAQLVGIDKNGREIYEGDIVISEGGRKYVAELRPIVKDKNALGDNAYRHFDSFILAEEENEIRTTAVED